MAFLVITEEGELLTIGKPPSPAALATVFGNKLLHRIAVEWGDMRGHVCDYGLTPQGWNGTKRNPTGACTLAALGAQPRVIAGPVAFTGWDTQRSEPADLSEWARTVVGDMYVAADCAMSGLPSGHGERWDAAIFRMGHLVSNLAIPPMILMESF